MIDALIPYAYKAYLYNERSQAPSGLPYRFIFKSVLPIGLCWWRWRCCPARCAAAPCCSFPAGPDGPSDERDRTRSQP